MRPCDIKDTVSLSDLNESGVAYNNWCFYLTPSSITIENGTTKLKIPAKYMQRFAEWFLEDQQI